MHGLSCFCPERVIVVLVSDAYRFVVATPTKCGAHSFNGLASEWERGGGDPGVLRSMWSGAKDKHRLAPPEGCEDYLRFLVVRNPAERMVSMWDWLSRRKGEWMHRDVRKLDGFPEFVEWLWEQRQAASGASGGSGAAARGPGAGGVRLFLWTDTLQEQMNLLRGTWGGESCRGGAGEGG